MPNRRQAIIWTNADSIQWRICGAAGEMSLIANFEIWIWGKQKYGKMDNTEKHLIFHEMHVKT